MKKQKESTVIRMLVNSIKKHTPPIPKVKSCSILILFTTQYQNYPHLNHNHTRCSYSSAAAVHSLRLSPNEVVASFKNWFKSRDAALLNRIFSILKSQDHVSPDDVLSRHTADLALSHLNLRLSEAFVLQVLSYGRSKGVLPCLKFFDWAGRQPGFFHTQATFHAIFKIISKEKLMSLVMDFLREYMEHRFVHKGRFYDTLVIGYAVAGKPEMALQLFGKMRFMGSDLNDYAYHVLLNALVEQRCFDAFNMLAKQISERGLENVITHSIKVKCLCKQNKVDEAEDYLRGLVERGYLKVGNAVSVVVDALCKCNRFKHAATLLDDFKELDVSMEDSYGIWLKNLVLLGRLNGALEFIKNKKSLEGYAPDIFRYNFLVLRLLKEDRLEDVCDLLIEMEEDGISPDEVTMNAVLCFFCKAGMVDVAIELYKSRSVLGLSLTSMAYNYLINILVGNGSVDEAYCLLRNSIREGYFPGKKTFAILANALCGEGKLDKMKELVVVALEKNFMPSDSVYEKFIAALCKANRVEDGYLIHGELTRMNKNCARNTYFSLILGFNKSNRGDIAARLLLEMQEKGYRPSKMLFRTVIRCLCDMQNSETLFFKLLEMQLSHIKPGFRICDIYELFIGGAGHAYRPDLARKALDMLQRSGISPTPTADILVLQSYLRNHRISDAMNFFKDVLRRRGMGKKLYRTMVIGLCKTNKADYALKFMTEMRSNNLLPTVDCYEYLMKLLCSNKNFDLVVHLVNDLGKTGRRISSFIGNVLLFHSFQSKELYDAWIRIGDMPDGRSDIWLLGQLIGLFSGCIEVSQEVENLQDMIEECFPPTIYTYNLLLKKLSLNKIDRALELYEWICQKGYKPNRWTYEHMIHGFLLNGRRAEASRWIEEMYRRGFDITRSTKQLI